MAETKNKRGTGARSRRTTSRSNGSQARSSASRRANGSSKARSASGKARATSGKARATSGKARATSGKARSAGTNSKAATKKPQKAGGQVMEEATTPLARVASKAKAPLLAGGAVVAGVAGGMALSRSGNNRKLSLPKVGGGRKKVTMPNLSLPKRNLGNGGTTAKALGATAKALGNTAAEIGKAGYRVGELTSEVRRVREQASKQD